ncbi:MAG: helix-turn-helix transcriptional regulator [Chloroflexi bacterium]|nr:helix-turn-helix transcriptional regulator [Chloroflexota bacterium]
MMAIRSRLRHLITEYETKTGRKLPISVLARELGMSENTLLNLASNTTQRFDAPVLDKLCKFFGVPLSELLVYENEETTKMTTRYKLPQDTTEANAQLKMKMSGIIEEMPEVFTSHQFILKFAHLNQQEYVGALAAYAVTSNAPFQIVHGNLSKYLHDFPQLVEQTSPAVPSIDIFGEAQLCAQWRRKR